jgi:hypothetical protein
MAKREDGSKGKKKKKRERERERVRNKKADVTGTTQCNSTA